MTEDQIESDDTEPDVTPAVATEPDVATGVPVVDEVLGRLEGLDDQPVEEHLPIFEAAHEQLRGALDNVDGADPEPQPD